MAQEPAASQVNTTSTVMDLTGDGDDDDDHGAGNVYKRVTPDRLVWLWLICLPFNIWHLDQSWQVKCRS